MSSPLQPEGHRLANQQRVAFVRTAHHSCLQLNSVLLEIALRPSLRAVQFRERTLHSCQGPYSREDPQGVLRAYCAQS